MTLKKALEAITFTNDSIKRPNVGQAIRFDQYGSVIYTNTGSYTKPFTLEEILANDWEVIKPRFTFMEAMEFVKEGKKVRRHGWSTNVHIKKSGVNNTTFVMYGNSSSFDLLLSEVFATDWEILE